MHIFTYGDRDDFNWILFILFQFEIDCLNSVLNIVHSCKNGSMPTINPFQLCTRPDVDNHWALRDFASRLMANICKNFNSSTNSVQTRVTRVFSEAMRTERNPLVCYYGAIAGLQVSEEKYSRDRS